MKMMLCESCMSVVVPHKQDNVARWCSCKKSACWWENGSEGRLAIYRPDGDSKQVSGLGLHNDLLRAHFDKIGVDAREIQVSGSVEDAIAAMKKIGEAAEYGLIREDVIQAILEATPSSYAFKRVNSLIIRFRPGFTTDVRFVSDEKDLPQLEVQEQVVTRS